MSGRWHELRHDPLEVEKTIKALQFIRSPAEIEFQPREKWKGPWMEHPVWSMDRRSGRFFFAGNEHGDILRFLEVYRQMRHPMTPLTVVNFDGHFDDRRFFNLKRDAHLAWQRYMVEKQITTRSSSYNVLAGWGSQRDSDVTRPFLVNQFMASAVPSFIDLFSVDVDVYNGHPPDTDVGTGVTQAIHTCILRSTAVMAFLSPTYSTHGHEEAVIQDLFANTIADPVHPLHV